MPLVYHYTTYARGRLCLKSQTYMDPGPKANIVSSAKGAEYKSQGQARSASPLVYAVRAIRPEGPKYVQYYAPSGLGEFDSSRGDALRACPWLSFCAPLALHPRRFALALALILRALALHPRRFWRALPNTTFEAKPTDPRLPSINKGLDNARERKSEKDRTKKRQPRTRSK